jgi:UDP:flavonoid glycosyltransferase YjiC (YdhE family)
MVKNGLNPRTILFMPANSQGHVNSSVAIAQVFVERGHRVVFILEKPFQGKLKSYGIQEVILESIIDPNNDQAKDDQEYWPAFVAKNCSIFRKTPIDIIERFNVRISESLVKIERAKEGQYKKIIESVKPDLMVLDTYLCSPCLTNSGIPWVRIISTNPLLALEDESSPPGMSGLPSSGVNVEQEWIKFQSRKKELYEPIWKDVNEWVLSLNAPQLPPNPLLHPDSPYANLYMQPKEIDLYEDQGFPLRPNWFRFDSFIRETKETFILPESFKTRKGKLVYLSMGTIGSADVSLMTRLVDILKDSPNKFIVSKGVLGDKYRLPDNMWGQNSLPQTKVK